MAFGIQSNFSEEKSDEGLKPLPKKSTEQQQQQQQQQQQEEVKKPIEAKGKILPEAKKVDDVKKEKPSVKPEKTPSSVELNDEQVSAYLKNKYKDRQFETLDDFVKTPDPIEKEVEKIVNPWDDVLDDEDKAYLEYKRETGRTRKEFDFLKEDLSKLSLLELAQKKVQSDTGMSLNENQLKEYLTNTLEIDFGEDELTTTDKIKLNGFVKPIKDSHLEQKEKYRKPLEDKLKSKEPEPEMVTLDNGQTMTKAEYDIKKEQYRVYTESVTKAVDSVASFDFKIPIDNNGEKIDLDISYELSKEDKHSMLSDALNVDGTIQREFQTEQGFDHSGLAQTLYRGQQKNFNKIMLSVAEKVRAATIEELVSNSNNENFNLKPIEKVKTGKEGYGELPTGETKRGTFGVQYGGFGS